MKVIEGLEAIQGSDEWLARRARPNARNASEAAAVMGVSPYTTRDQLLAEKATGIKPEVTPAQQAVYDEGHRVEPLLRAMCEGLIGDELSPLCADSDDGYLSASFDGVTFDGTKLFEAKQSNQSKLLAIREQRIPDGDYWQCVQQFAVCETAQILYYYCGDGEPTHTAYYTQLRTPQIEADIVKLRAAWAQFDKDLAAYQPPEPAAPVAIGHAPETLPALAVQITGAVTASNLPEFKEQALRLIRGVKTELVTDQDFSDALVTIKWAGDIEERIAAVKQAALSQTASIDELFRTMDDISDEARRVRLQLSKSVKTEKEARKQALVAAAFDAMTAHMGTLNKRLGMNAISYEGARIGAAIKGMSSLANMQSTVNDVVAALKVETSAEADRIDANLKLFAEHAAGHEHLFADKRALVVKQADDLQATITSRIAEAKAAEEKRLEAERERIRAEEEAKAKAAADAAVAKMAAEAEAEVQAEAKAKTDAKRAGRQQQAEAEARAAQRVRAKQATEAAANTQPTLTLGAINLRLEPIHLTAAGLAKLGIEPKATDKAAKLYTEDQFFNLLCELTNHLDRAMSKVRRGQTEMEAA